MEKHKHGGDIYSREIEMDYSANISPLGLPRRSVEAIRASLERLVHYPDVECRSLRAMLSEKAGIPADFQKSRHESGVNFFDSGDAADSWSVLCDYGQYQPVYGSGQAGL